MSIKNFDEFIRKTVRLFVHPVWFIHLDENHICPCVDRTSNVAKKNCLNCNFLLTKACWTFLTPAISNVIPSTRITAVNSGL